MDYANENLPRILVIDIETKLIDIRAFGIRDQYIDIKQIVDIQRSAEAFTVSASSSSESAKPPSSANGNTATTI